MSTPFRFNYSKPQQDIFSSEARKTASTQSTSSSSSIINTNGVSSPGTLIEVIVNDRLGKKVRVKCTKEDTIGQLKKLISAQTGTKAEKMVLKKWYNIYKDQITLADYEISDAMCYAPCCMKEGSGLAIYTNLE